MPLLLPWLRVRAFVKQLRRQKSGRAQRIPKTAGTFINVSILALPDEILYLICADLVGEFLVDALVDDKRHNDKQSHAFLQRANDSVLSFGRTCRRIRSVLANTLASALSVEMMPDGSPSQNPWRKIASLRKKLIQARRAQLKERVPQLDETDRVFGEYVEYEAAVQILSVSFRIAEFKWAMPRHSRREQHRWRMCLLIVSVEVVKLTGSSINVLLYLRRNLACSPVIQPYLYAKIGDCVRIHITLWLCRSIAQAIYQSIESIRSSDFAIKSVEEQGEIWSTLRRNLVMIVEEKVVCEEIMSNQEFTMHQFHGDQILMSGLMAIVIYMRRYSLTDVCVHDMTIAEVGEKLWQRWLPRMPVAYWKHTGLQNQDTHAAFIAMFPQYFAVRA